MLVNMTENRWITKKYDRKQALPGWILIASGVVAGILIVLMILIACVGHMLRSRVGEKGEVEEEVIPMIMHFPKDEQEEYLNGMQTDMVVTAAVNGSMAADAEHYATSYIIEDSDRRLLSVEELTEGYTYGELYYAYYELFARHHVIFGEEVVDGFFRGKRWYTGSVTAEEFRDNDDRFNDYEVANKEAILQAFQILYGMEKNKGMNDE